MSADPLGTTAASAASNELWGEDWPDVRAMWPLEPTIAHLNHGSYGAVPRVVLEEQQSWRDRMESNPVRFFTRELPGALDEARAEVAHFLGTGADDIAFLDNVTTAVNTVLSCVPLAPGDEVLVTDHAYAAVAAAAKRWATAAGAAVVTAHVPLAAQGDAVLDSLLRALTPRTRFAVIEHVTSPTARRLPLDTLVPALQERGVTVLVDSAHALGMIGLRLEEIGADFATASLNKWGCAPRGGAVLHAAAHWRKQLRPLVAWAGDDAGFPHAFPDDGARDATAWLAAPRALRVLDHLGLERVRRHNVELAMLGQRVVASALDLDDQALPRDADVSMQLIPLPPGVAQTRAAAAALQAQLSERAAVEVAITTWLGQGFVRVSAHTYNAPADYDRLAAALPRLVADAER